jgi:hypothetical protein
VQIKFKVFSCFSFLIVMLVEQFFFFLLNVDLKVKSKVLKLTMWVFISFAVFPFQQGNYIL